MNTEVGLHWLEDPPKAPTGVSWGVPWNEGTLSREDAFELIGDNGESVPVQSWPTAYWPDGSVKWTGHAATVTDAPNEFTLAVSEGPSERDTDSKQQLAVDDAGDYIEVDTGRAICQINKRGSTLIRTFRTRENTVCTDGRLVCRREPRNESGERRVGEDERFEGHVEDVSLEREGDIRTVVKIEGTHEAVDGDREWLPFTLRLTFHAGISSIEATHTCVFDGDSEQDFITGLGVSFAVPLTGPEYNRHVRFSGEKGLFREPARVLPPRAREGDQERATRQIEGDPLDPDPDETAEWARQIEQVTSWNSFKLVQNSPDHHVIKKTAGTDYCWVDAAHGRRSTGLAFVGDADGGLAVGTEDFWETYPSSLEVIDVLEREARLRVWFWSPDGEAMDLRRYDEAGTDASGAAYGGIDDELSTPHGVAKTSEFTLRGFDEIPDRQTLLDCADEARSPSFPVCAPERYHEVGAFGRWSLEDRSTPARAWVEDQLDAAIEFYRDEVEQRRWYGFWDYGDIMHSYDSARHNWYYDTGGYAWQNTEQVPTMWFWYMFLRSGRADVFRLAEAQTRHTSEVDVYHDGPLTGLGSRHNVLHWAGGCKEPRIAMTGHHRFYYYLTGGDERLGEVFREVRDADLATLDLDPMRNHVEDDDCPTHARIAPDWLSYSANWMTEWERFESEDYREKLLTGIESVKEMPLRMFSGSTFGYDPRTGALHHIGDGNYGHTFLHCMGGPQIWPELGALIDDPEWEEMLAETGELYLDEEARDERLPEQVVQSFDLLPMYATNMAGFAAELHDDDELAAKTWDLLLFDEERRVTLPMERRTVDEGHSAPVEELPAVKTNIMSIWSLNVIACLEYIGEYLPDPPTE